MILGMIRNLLKFFNLFSIWPLQLLDFPHSAPKAQLDVQLQFESFNDQMSPGKVRESNCWF